MKYIAYLVTSLNNVNVLAALSFVISFLDDVNFIIFYCLHDTFFNAYMIIAHSKLHYCFYYEILCI